MAKKDEAKEGQGAPLVVDAVLNPSTGLGGYGFDDGFTMLAGKRYPLSEDEYKQYSKEKHNGQQVIKKV